MPLAECSVGQDHPCSKETVIDVSAWGEEVREKALLLKLVHFLKTEGHCLIATLSEADQKYVDVLQPTKVKDGLAKRWHQEFLGQDIGTSTRD